MTIENKKQATRFKRIFFITSIAIALVALTLFFMDYNYYALGCIGIFSIWYLYFHVADYMFIEFSTENNMVILRYFKAVRFGKGQYSSIEFPQYMLRKVYFENSVFGKLSDVTFIVKTKRGIAEYPSVSLSAVSYKDRVKMQKVLNEILGI